MTRKSLSQLLSGKIFPVVVTVFAFCGIHAQVALPDPYPANSKISFVRIWMAAIPETNENVLTVRSLGDVVQSTEYFDGIGRSIQTVVKQGSLIKNQYNNDVVYDLVSANRYDQLGRQQYQYPAFTSTIPSGTLKTDPFQQQAAFIQGQFPGETFYYNKTEFELSPLNRIVKSLAPGDSWVGNNRGIDIQYELNNAAEGVRIWNIDFTSGSLPFTTATYPAGKLSKSVMLDEKGKKAYIYADYEGKTILKKVQDKEPGAGLDENSHAGWLCTYYVYDDLGQLRSTITPKAVKYLESNSWVFANTDVYQELCFWYEFDERGRAVIKHIPGAGQIYLVYDNKDRLVLSQDENQRSRTPDQWTFYLYDNLDRTVATGLFDNNATYSAMEAHVKALNNGIVNITVYTGSNETLKLDNPVAGSPSYCNNCTNTIINTVNYYDDYSYPGVKSFNTNFSFAPANTNPYMAPVPYIEPTQQSVRTTGFSTGTKTRVIDQNYDDNNPSNDIFLTATTYYDDKGRLIQSLTDNIKNAVDYITTQYDFSGSVLSVCEKHTMPGTSFNNYQVISKNDYDFLHRVTAVSKKYGDLDYKKLASYSYDEMGRAKNKKLSPDFNSGAGIENFKYDYNIRGWLNGINKDWALASTSLNQWEHYFGMYMGYDNRDNMFSAPQYNGNLTGTIWKTQGDNMPRRYDYQYDNAGRFIQALYQQKEKPTDAVWNNLKMDFSVTSILYDENNNLKQMHQKGVVPGNSSPLYIDKLIYDYKQVAGAEWSNQLRRVFDQTTDLTAANNGALGDFKDETYAVNGEDYVFDGNGNLVKDHNKKIRIGSTNGVQYNFMDKPQKVTIENKSVTEFIYDADGVKLGKKITNTITGTSKTTWYVGDFIYEETTSQVKLTMILHEEGRIRVFEPVNNPRITQGGYVDLISGSDPNKGVFEFFIKDNLQNTRAIVTEETYSEFNNCTMESASSFYEERMFGQVDASGNPITNVNEVQITRVPKTDAAGWGSNSSEKVSKLSWYGSKVGPNVILKVMAGDEVATRADYYYTGTPDNSDNNNILTPILNAMLSALSNTAPAVNLHGSAGNITNNYVANPGDLGSFLSAQSNGGNATPQAYLNILFFDENFNFVAYDPVTGLGSNAWRVSAAGDGQSIPVQVSRAPKNGYVFVYLSNESKTPVFFDNFEVSHIRGRLIEENAYYPYGLKIKGISAKAFDKGDNNYGYQGDFSEEDSETAWDEFALRMYDAQIGKWTGVDPYDEFASPYVGMGSNPVNFIDKDGGQIGPGGWSAIFGAISGYFIGHKIAKKNGANGFRSVMWGLAGSFVGAGIGYGIGASLAGQGPVLMNTAGFYSRLFGGSGHINGKYDALNRGWAYVDVPKIWGKIALPAINIGNLWVDAKPKFEWITYFMEIFDSNPPADNPNIRPLDRTIGTPTEVRDQYFSYGTSIPVSASVTSEIPDPPVQGAETRTKVDIPFQSAGTYAGFVFSMGRVDIEVHSTVSINGINQNTNSKYYSGTGIINISIWYNAYFSDAKSFMGSPEQVVNPSKIKIKTEYKKEIPRQKLKILPFIKRKVK